MKTSRTWWNIMAFNALVSASIGIHEAQLHWNEGHSCMFPAPMSGILAGIVSACGSLLVCLALSPIVALLISYTTQRIRGYREKFMAQEGQAPAEVTPDETLTDMPSRQPRATMIMYLQSLAQRFGLFSAAGALMFFGMVFLFMGIAVIALFWEGIAYAPFILVGPLIMMSNGYLLLRGSKNLFTKGQAIPIVEPITAHNSHLLPPQEILLRGCDLQPARHRNELLRSARPDHVTDGHELLRAAQEEGIPGEK